VTATFTIDRALTDPRLLGAGLGAVESWRTWLVVLRAAFGLPLDDDERKVFANVAGGRVPPRSRVRELWCVAGRRSGKSRVSAAIAIYLALFAKHKLARGEKGMCLIIAGSTAQASTVFNYIRGFLEASPALAKEVAAVSRHEVTLRNGIILGVHSNSFRTVRGRTLVACVMDEVAYWRDLDSALPDTETYSAVLPALATTNGMLVGISTPYRKLGLLHQKHRDHFGVDGDDVLVVQGGSAAFNPTLSTAIIATQRAADPTAAGAEWDALFRTDISAYLDDELIDAAVEHGRPLELPPRGGVHYQAFTDPAGGVGADSYTLVIAHKDNVGRVIVDVVRGTNGKFNPEQVTWEYAQLLKQYGIGSVTGDSYGAEWVASSWQKCGVNYVRSEQSKSELYLEATPLFTRGLIRLPDHAKLLRELRLLERHTHRSGRDTVDHPKGGRDDHANAVCGVAVLVGGAALSVASLITPSLLGRLASMPRYRRPLGDDRAVAQIGERRAAQQAWARDRRTYGW
jgi:hypothetical protein